MSQAKRRDYGYHKATSSPWANESWEQSHSTDLRTRLEHPRDRDTRMTRWKEKKANRQPLRPRCTWNPFKYDRSPSPPKVAQPPFARVRFHHHRCSVYPNSFHQDIYYHDPNLGVHTPPRAPQTMSEEEEEPLHTNIDETALQATDFSPIKPPETEGVPPINDETGSEPVENTDGEEDTQWDEEGNDAHRRLMRSQPLSFDADGYKLPIYGVLSPEAKLWNDNHRLNLHREAAEEQQTPSRPPRNSGSTVARHKQGTRGKKSLSPPRSTDQEDAELRAAEAAEAADAAKAAEKAETKRRAQLKAKFDEDHPKVSHTKPVSAAAILEIENLSLEPVKPERTPKAFSHQENKELHKKSRLERRAALEAAKEVYPLVPLSKAWEDKVRHAVNHGAGRFDAISFSRCVPEYSRDPNAGSLWLDDAVINDYITMVAKHGSRDEKSAKMPPNMAALSSFFFSKISASNPNYTSVNRIVKRAGITGDLLLFCEKVFIPINKNSHWILAVIEPKIPSDSAALEPKRKVTVYDSMGKWGGGRQVAEQIMDWIRHELGARFKEEEWDVNPAGESPQQVNGVDCGVFTCTTARQIMLGRYQDINHRYKPSAIKDMRKRLVAELVHDGLLNKDESISEVIQAKKDK